METLARPFFKPAGTAEQDRPASRTNLSRTLWRQQWPQLLLAAAAGTQPTPAENLTAARQKTDDVVAEQGPPPPSLVPNWTPTYNMSESTLVMPW